MEDKRTSAVGISLVLALPLLALLYVLSIGPYALLFAGDEPAWGGYFYAPLKWLDNRSQWLSAFIRWYVGLWLPSDRY